MTDRITLAEAADRLGVHYMTAYRYVRTGRLKAVKTGGVWSVPVAEIVEFSNASATPPDRRDDYPGYLEARLLAGDENGSLRILEQALSSGAGADEVYLDLLCSAMQSIGSRWAAGELTISDEHVATATALRVIGRLGPLVAPRGRTKGTVLLAVVAGDNHSLPTALLRDLLRHRSFDAIDLGANTPAESLLERALETTELLAVGLAATSTGNEDRIRETLRVLAGGVSVPVVLGGAAIRSEHHGHSLGVCTPSTSPRHALELFEQIHEDARTSA